MRVILKLLLIKSKLLFSILMEIVPLVHIGYQHCWEIVGDNICKPVMEFFRGMPLPTYFLENFICMVPKKEIPTRLGDFRPISLCNVSYKIFSKIITVRLANILPRVISSEQGAFVKDKLITKNIGLA